MVWFKRVWRFLWVVIIVIAGCNFPTKGLVPATGPAGNKPQAPATDSTVYLPLVQRDYPLQTLFGVTLLSITPEGGIDLMKEAGSQWVRQDFIWNAIQPTEGGPLNWAAVQNLEQQMVNARQAGMELILIFGGTPAWAEKNPERPECGPVAADKFPALGNTLRQVVQRYSAPPFNVTYFELWNEPDLNGSLGCWGDTADPVYNGGRHYGEMLKAVYPVIKAANPSAQVLTGGLLLDCDPDANPTPCQSDWHRALSRFMEGILLSGAGYSFDGINFHAYDYYSANLGLGHYRNPSWNSTELNGPSTLAKLRYLRGLLAKYNIQGKFFMNTETGLNCGADVEPTCNYSDTVLIPDAKLTKAYYLVQSYTTAQAEGLRANVWYHATGARGTGIIPGLVPETGYYAFKFTRNILSGAKLTRVPPVPGDVFAYEFNRGDRLIWVLWSKTGAEIDVALPKQPTAGYSIGSTGDGVAIAPLATTIRVGLAPVFLEFAP